MCICFQVKLEERCKMEMESHKQLLDKEYETLLQQFSKDLEKLQLRHLQELERKLKQNQNAEKKLNKEITSRQEADRKALEAQQKREYKVRYRHRKIWIYKILTCLIYTISIYIGLQRKMEKRTLSGRGNSKEATRCYTSKSKRQFKTDGSARGTTAC